MNRSFFRRHILGRTWWLEPFEQATKTPANQFTARLRNIWRRWHGRELIRDVGWDW